MAAAAALDGPGGRLRSGLSARAPAAAAAACRRHRARDRSPRSLQGDGEDQRRPPPQRPGADLQPGARDRHRGPVRARAGRKVTFFLNGDKLLTKSAKVQKGKGDTASSSARIRLRHGGKYAVSAQHVANRRLGGDRTVRKSWKVCFSRSATGECGRSRQGLQGGAAKMGYVASGGHCFNGRIGREVLAYRKVNDMTRNEHAGTGLVKSVFAGKGGYHVNHPDAGEHVEVPLSKQVLVLAKGDKPFAIYPVSTRQALDPDRHRPLQLLPRRSRATTREGMYYSRLLLRRLRGPRLRSVPDYPASHGCVRTFIADQPRDLRADLLRRGHLRLLGAVGWPASMTRAQPAGGARASIARLPRRHRRRWRWSRPTPSSTRSAITGSRTATTSATSGAFIARLRRRRRRSPWSGPPGGRRSSGWGRSGTAFHAINHAFDTGEASSEARGWTTRC